MWLVLEHLDRLANCGLAEDLGPLSAGELRTARYKQRMVSKYGQGVAADPAFASRDRYIYGLVDDDGQLRYVGQALDPEARLRAHTRGRAVAMTRALADELAARGSSLRMAILDFVPAWTPRAHRVANKRERAWIAYAERRGCQLLNRNGSSRYVEARAADLARFSARWSAANIAGGTLA